MDCISNDEKSGNITAYLLKIVNLVPLKYIIYEDYSFGVRFICLILHHDQKTTSPYRSGFNT